jgi:hypothetical protein
VVRVDPASHWPRAADVYPRPQGRRFAAASQCHTAGQSPAASRTLRLDIPLAAVNKAAAFEQSLAA